MATATAPQARKVQPPKVKDQPMLIGGKWVDSQSGKASIAAQVHHVGRSGLNARAVARIRQAETADNLTAGEIHGLDQHLRSDHVHLFLVRRKCRVSIPNHPSIDG